MHHALLFFGGWSCFSNPGERLQALLHGPARRRAVRERTARRSEGKTLLGGVLTVGDQRDFGYWALSESLREWAWEWHSTAHCPSSPEVVVVRAVRRGVFDPETALPTWCSATSITAWDQRPDAILVPGHPTCSDRSWF